MSLAEGPKVMIVESDEEEVDVLLEKGDFDFDGGGAGR